MYESEQNMGVPTKEQSPIEKLNEKLESNNSNILNLLDRITSVGARISADHPKEDIINKQEPMPSIPFNEGYLMEYLYKINRQEQLISQLRNQVCKLEGLF